MKCVQSTCEGAAIPLKFLFSVPVQVWCTLKFKSFVFLSLCRFGALEVQNGFCVPVQVWCILKLKF